MSRKRLTVSDLTATPVWPPPEERPRRRLPRPDFTSLRYGEFRFYWVSAVLVFFDHGMANVALAWLVLDLTDSAAWVGAAVAARGLPMFVLTIPAGVWADRWNRRTLLILTQSTAAISALVFAVLVATGLANVYVALIYATLLGTSNALSLPARQAVIPMLVPSEQLHNAVVLGTMARTSSLLIGPGLAGILIAGWGAEASFAAQAGFLVLSTLLLFPLRSAARRVVERAEDAQSSMLGELAEAMGFLRSQLPLMVILMLMVNTGLFMIGPNQALMSVLVRDELGGDSTGLGLALTLMSLGTLVTSLFLTSTGAMRNKGGFFAMSLVGGAASFAAIALSPSLNGAVGFFLIWGVFSGFFQAMSNSLLQSHTPEEFMGRVMGVNMMASLGTMPLGALLAGAMATLWGPSSSAVIAAAACGTISFVALIAFPSFRRLS